MHEAVIHGALQACAARADRWRGNEWVRAAGWHPRTDLCVDQPPSEPPPGWAESARLSGAMLLWALDRMLARRRAFLRWHTLYTTMVTAMVMSMTVTMVPTTDPMISPEVAPVTSHDLSM